MADQEIQKILDDLDVQLAAGNVDLPTYKALVKKWSARISPPPYGDDLKSTSPSASVVVTKVACPNCGAPLGEAFSTARESYACQYCSHTFTAQRAHQETEKLKRELQGWLSQLVTSVAPEGVIDPSSRAFIFREKVYPSLEVEFNRAQERLEGFQDFPFFEVRLGNRFKEYTLAASPLTAQHEQLARIRSISAKISAPAIREFATSPEADRQLAYIESKARELIYAANVVEQSHKLSAEGYAAARQNIGALHEVWSQAKAQARSESERQFREACLVRLHGIQIVLDVLHRIYQSTSGEITGSNFCEELETAVRDYKEALTLAERSKYSAMETVPWQRGVERELRLVALESALLSCYHRAVTNRSGNFFKFQSDVERFLDRSGAFVGDPQSLAKLLDSLTTILEARRGSRGLARLADWAWLEPAVEQQRRKSVVAFMGVNEQVEHVEQYWHPYWMGDLSYSQSEGTVFKSGATKRGLLLLDATSTQQVLALVVEEASSLFTRIESATRREVADGRLTLPALISEAAAQRVLEGYVHSAPGFRNCQVKMRSVVYLPAAQVIYQSKHGSRPSNFSPVGVINGGTANLRRATYEFITQYAG